MSVYPKTVQNLQTNYQTKLTSVENAKERVQEQLASLFLKIGMDDRKEGAPPKQSSDPFDQTSEHPPMTKLQRSILVENQKHNI